MKRALIIKIGAIGDAVMALPLARELRKTGFSQVSWLAGKDISNLISLAPEVSSTLIVDERALFGSSKVRAGLEVLKTWWQLRSVNVDDLYLLHADSRYKLLIPPWLRAKIHVVRVGGRRHHTFDYARLAYPEAEDRELEFSPYTITPELDRENRICIFPGGAKNAMRDNPLRRWPLEHYVELCSDLIGRGFNVSIVGGPSDSWIETAFAQLRPSLSWQVGTMKLTETVQYLRKSMLAVSHDTGPVHLASLANCPIITIFGPTNSEWFAPLNFRSLVLEKTPKMACQPCYDGKEFGACTRNLCISEIYPNQVVEKIKSVLTP